MLAIRWKDLIRLTPWERLVELTVPVPWLVASLAASHARLWSLSALCWFFLFLTGLRLSHNAQHRSLGLPHWAHDLVLAALSLVMGASMHAVQVSHLNHHRHELGPDDVEGRVVALPLGEVLRAGPRFMFELHRFALTRGTATQRRWVWAELGLLAVIWPALVLFGGHAIAAHVVAMSAGELLTPFFAVWLVHRAARGTPSRARTERSWLINTFTYGMLLHAEHHAYPAVPTIHWRQLAERRAAAGERVERDVVALH
ncbi:MAG: fatty acid desaturase [Archangium sp.]|nr:fatty acid desaturase [Archangium sp.]